MNYPITFGKYQLLERVNIGGMAEVFKAKAFGVEGFERILAIKRILPNMADDDEFINMFVDEARIAVQLSHPNIVQIYELGRFEGQYYIAMEYVSGKDLRQILDRLRKKQETLAPTAAAFIVSQLCEGLDYAHRRTDPGGRPMNLIHRDVSPQNVLVGYEGAVKLTDFGIAKAEDRASKTQAGVLKGKFGYMSPEQVRGLEIDNRSDVFALGILLYEMVTGKRLFVGESDFSTLEKVRNADIISPREHTPDLSEELEAVILKALARDRDERYQMASELHDDLQQFLIEEHSIYNAKRLAALMASEYQAEIAAELQRLEEFLRLPPPSTREALNAAEQMQSAPTGDWSADNRDEKTMIFDSAFGDMSSMETRIAPPTAETREADGFGHDDADRYGGDPPRGPGEASGLGLPSPPGPGASLTSRSARHGALLIGVTAAVSLLGLIAVLLAGPCGGVGTIVVTSSPVSEVQIFMDGALIGDKTPLTKRDVPVGYHTLLARAVGYRDKAYRFDLAAGAPAVIHVEMERNTAMSQGTAVLEVVSDPAMASVRIGALPQGVTPLTLKNQDPTRPVILEVGKPGYETQTVSVSFNPGERRKTVRVRLTPLGKSAGLSAAPPGEGAKVTVTSKPPGATVSFDGARKGQTPLTVAGLNPAASYDVEVSKSGYHPHRVSLAMAGRAIVQIDAPLQRKAKTRARVGNGGCGGTGGQLSVMPVGVADCTVRVGNANLGVAPVFKKAAPVGRCAIEVRCPGGKSYRTTKTLKAGSETKVIIKGADWTTTAPR